MTFKDLIPVFNITYKLTVYTNWGEHVFAKVTSGIQALRNLAKLFPPTILKMAYFSLVYPHLQYGIKL